MRIDWVSLALIAAALAATAAVYPLLPEIVPRHWNIYGQVDAWSPRASIFGMIGATALLFALFTVIPRLDRKGSLASRPGVYHGFVRAFVLAFLVIHAGTVAAAMGHPLGMGQLTAVTFGLLLVYVGNHLPQVRPNHFLGIRTWWTLADETTWRVTHRAGGYATMAGGAVLAALGLVLKEPWTFVALLGLVGLLVLAAIVGSWAVYRSKSR